MKPESCSIQDASLAIDRWREWPKERDPDTVRQLGITRLIPGERTIYFAVAGDLLKVGSSKNNPLTRVRSLPRNSGIGWEFIAHVRCCDRSCEIEFHHLLSRWSRRFYSSADREWFRWCEPTQRLVEMLLAAGSKQNVSAA